MAPSDPITPKTVGLIAFDGMTMLDWGAAAGVFSWATVPTGSKRYHGYRLVTIGISRRPCTAGSGVVVLPQETLESAPNVDTLIIPGEARTHPAHLQKNLTSWLNERAPKTRRFAAVAGGVYTLAATGLLDGREVTAHWTQTKDIERRFPNLRVRHNALFIKDGPFCTSAGGTAAIDFFLALVEEDYGREVALGLARDLVMPVKRAGEQAQLSESLKFQAEATDRFADIAAWILTHLSEDLSVEKLAAQACLSPRHFRRLFKKTFGKTPAAFVDEARLDEARRRLEIPRSTVKTVGSSVGFKSSFAFCRAFERRFGRTPKEYQASSDGGDSPPLERITRPRKADYFLAGSV